MEVMISSETPVNIRITRRYIPEGALTGWDLSGELMFPVRYGLSTQCICVFRTVLTAKSDCFPTQH
jgi:hypothetical protein